MGRIIFGTGLAGIGSITALAYWLADKRIAVCHMADTYTAEANCTVRAMAVRDSILTGGLVVALLVILAAMIFYSRARLPLRRFGGFSGFRSANRAARPLPRA